MMGKPKSKKWGMKLPGMSKRSKKMRQLSDQQRQQKYRTILSAYYEKYNPQKLGDIDKTLAVYAGKEEAMIEAMEEKYGKVEIGNGGDDDDDDDDWCTAFSGEELREGVHYMEVVLGGDMEDLLVGIARPGLDTADGKKYHCGSAYASPTNPFVMLYGVWLHGSLCGNGKYDSDEAGAYAAGDKMGVLLDLDAGSVLFFKNGAKHGPGWAAGSVTGPVVLAVQMYLTGSSAEVVADAVRPI
jgi:hypothetical protein